MEAWLLYGAGLAGVGLAAQHMFRRYRTRTRQALVGETVLGVFILVVFILPALHTVLLLAEAREKQRAHRALYEWCHRDPDKALEVAAWHGTQHICPDAMQHARPLVSIWVGLLWEHGLCSTYLGATCGETLHGLADGNPWTTLVKLAIVLGLVVGLPLGVAALAYREGWASGPPVFTRDDQLCFKLPGGEERCVCLHDKSPGTSPGPSE